MKKNIHPFTIGLIIGILLTISGISFAQSEIVQASFQKFLLVIDGNEPIEIEPLVYRGTTYLPVRQVSNLLGYSVTYRSDKRMIELTKTIIGKDESDMGMSGSWIDLNTLSRDYGIHIASGDDLTIGQITVKRPAAEPDRIETFQTEYGTIHIKIEKGRFYVILEEMKKAGVIQ